MHGLDRSGDCGEHPVFSHLLILLLLCRVRESIRQDHLQARVCSNLRDDAMRQDERQRRAAAELPDGCGCHRRRHSIQHAAVEQQPADGRWQVGLAPPRTSCCIMLAASTYQHRICAGKISRQVGLEGCQIRRVSIEHRAAGRGPGAATRCLSAGTLQKQALERSKNSQQKWLQRAQQWQLQE